MKTLIKKWLGLAALVVLISCNNNQPEKDREYVPNPTTLEELFRGFNQAELTPDIYHFDKEPVVVVATGHLYPLLKYPLAYQALIEEVNKQNPDYFFVLGDIVFNNTEEEWDTVFSYLKKVNAKIYFSPGNHDLNYHYERYEGKRDHQIEAEMQYLKEVGYRYKVVEDNLANYVFVNANDSAKRILSYINRMRQKMEITKQMFLFSSQSLWFNQQQDPNKNDTWVLRPFHREEFLPYVEDFQYLVHGDWNCRFFRGKFRKSHGRFDVIAVGNKRAGDSLYITRLLIYKDSVAAKPLFVSIPSECLWYKK